MTMGMRSLAIAALVYIGAAQTTTTVTTTNTSTTTGTSTNTTTTTSTTTGLTLNAVGPLVQSTECPVEACLGQNVTEIPGLRENHGFSLGDVIDICQSNGLEPCSRGHTIVGFNSLLVTPTVPSSFGGNQNVQVSVVVAAASAAVGNDPIAWFGKESREFWLPVGKLTPILHTRHLTMLASTFTGSPQEQWMDRIVVTNSDGFRLADIRIKKNIADYNRSKSPPNGFETLDLTLGMSKTPLTEMPQDAPSGQKKQYSRMEVSVVTEKLSKLFKWLPWHIDQVHIGKARREAVVVQSPDARFIIISSPATEYYGAVSYLSVEYAHLDIHILDMKNRASIRGLLPELWGLKKMSNRTKEMTCPPWSKEASQFKPPVDVDVDAEWNKRFFTV